jgi:Amt family ammonium transporter
VHITAGVAGLTSNLVIGNRKGFGTERFEPHNILLTFFGASLLWVGWYCFNAGSAHQAGPTAGIAMLNTQLSASTGALTWMITEWIIRKQPSVLGMLSGSIAGLVAITPCAGFVDQNGGFFIGFIAGPLCYFGAQIKHRLGLDDALDAFGIHAIGGTIGVLLLGFFATSEYAAADVAHAENAPTTTNGIFYGGNGHLLALQIYAWVVVVGWTVFATYCILQLIDKTIGLRVSDAEEDAGLDSSLHGESIVVSQESGVHHTSA